MNLHPTKLDPASFSLGSTDVAKLVSLTLSDADGDPLSVYDLLISARLPDSNKRQV